ncbi:MAG: transcription/translation regulatory transformer protein RfaH [Gammaproteobacteria bacterium]|nr:transcription/translation regulatory transformer protein RfaH [Gammaproteobacteria bacterium]
MHWYLIYTKPKYEKVALQNLEQQDFECYLPVMSIEKLHHRKIALSHEPLFPRYLFIRLDQSASGRSWSPIRSTRGVSRIVSFGNEPARVDDWLIEALRSHEEIEQNQPEQLFTPGEKVTLTEGAFSGIEGIYQMSDGESRVLVLIELLGKPVEMRISPASLAKTD